MSRRASPSTPARHGGLFRALRIGPALALAILASVVIWMIQRPDLQFEGRPPVVERVPRATNRLATTPDVAELLKHADELGLQPRQQKAIEHLVKQWEPESTERHQDMQAAGDAFGAAIREAQRHGRAGLAVIQHDAAPVSALTTQWLARKAYFWHRGLAELTQEQRQRVQKLTLERLRPVRSNG